MLWETLLPLLFFVKSKYLLPILVTLSTMSVNKACLGLLNTGTSEIEKYLSLQRASTELLKYVTGEVNFSNANHLLVLREEKRDGKKSGMTATTPN